MVLNLDREIRTEQKSEQNEDLMRNKRIAKEYSGRDLVLNLDREIRTEQKSERRLDEK